MAQILPSYKQVTKIILSRRWFMIASTRLERRSEPRNLLRFFAKMRIHKESGIQEEDVLVADTSEFGTSLFTHCLLPLGTKVQIVFDDKVYVGQIINRDYLFPEDTSLIRLGIHFDKQPENLPIKPSTS